MRALSASTFAWLVSTWILFLVGAFLQPASGQTIRESRQQLIQADSLDELQFMPERMLHIFKVLLRDIIEEDPDIASRVVIRTHELIENNRRSNPDGYFEDTRSRNNKTHISAYLEYYEASDESLDCIGLRVRTYRDDTKGVIQYDGRTSVASQARNYAFLSHFLSCGGNYQTSKALDKMLVDLRRVCGEGNSVFLAPEFLDLCSRLRPHQREQMVNWAYEKSMDADITISSIADAAILAASIFESAQGVTFNSSHVLRKEALDNQLLEILQDQTISPSWKIGFANILATHLTNNLSNRLRLEIGHLIIELATKKVAIENYTLINTTSAFLGDLSSSEDWLNAARKIIAAPDIIFHSSQDTIFTVSEWEKHHAAQQLAMTCRAGTKQQIEALCHKFDQESDFYHNIWIELIRARQFALANQLFNKYAGEKPIQIKNFLLQNTFDHQLANNVQDYLKSIETDYSDRLLAALLLAVIPNNQSIASDELSKTLSRQQRLKTAISQYGKNGVPVDIDNEKRLRIFELLTNCRQIPEATHWLEQEQKSLVDRLQQSNPKTSYWGARMEMHSAIEQLSQGMYFPALIFWGRIAQDRNITIGNRRRFISEAFLDLINENLEAAINEANIEVLNALLPFCRQILNTSSEIRPNHISSETMYHFVLGAAVAHAYCDQIHHWNHFWKDLSKEKQDDLSSLLQLYPTTVISYLNSLLNPSNLDSGQWHSTKFRRRVVSELLQTDWINQGLRDSSTLAELTAIGLITKQDLIAISEPIARNAPRQGNAWREYLGSLADNGRLTDALHEVSDQLAVDNPSKGFFYVLKLEKYLILNAMQKNNEANRFKLKHLLQEAPDSPREYSALIRRLERR